MISLFESHKWNLRRFCWYLVHVFMYVHSSMVAEVIDSYLSQIGYNYLQIHVHVCFDANNCMHVHVYTSTCRVCSVPLLMQETWAVNCMKAPWRLSTHPLLYLVFTKTSKVSWGSGMTSWCPIQGVMWCWHDVLVSHSANPRLRPYEWIIPYTGMPL